MELSPVINLTVSKVENLIKNQSPIVGIGTKVAIEVNGEPQVWEIVNIGESDIPKGKLSCNAPLTQCILRTREGDKINCEILNNNTKIIIKKIIPFFAKKTAHRFK